MKKTRAILAVTLLATALCADRSAVAAQQQRGASAAGVESGEAGFARRLAVSLRRAVSAINLHPGRLDMAAPVAANCADIESQDLGRVAQGTPFQFRLPPPAV